MQQQHRSNTSSSITTNGRRPHVWQDDMAEVKETFRRVARVKHSGYSLGDTSPTRVTAPSLSRNRRARIRSQVPCGPHSGLHVPVKVLHEIQGNRSQSPFVSLNHLQNVLGMCRRIRSQKSLTERRKNPHDPALYPVYVRRPWSVNACMYHRSPNPNPNITVSSNHPISPNPYLNPHDQTPLTYKPARFKPLYDISNGVFPYSDLRKRLSSRASASSEKLRTTAQEKPTWTHYKKLINHPIVDDSPNHNSNHSFTLNHSIISPSKRATAAAHFAWDSLEPENLIIAKKPRIKSSPMAFSESWPSSSSFSNDNISDLQANYLFHNPDYNELFLLNSDRRPHSENDLNLHSASYFLERPPSRCMKRPLSSCSWRNATGLIGDMSFWSPNSSSSQQDYSIFIPRDLNGNILISSAAKLISHNSTNGYNSKSFAGALLDLSKQHNATPNHTPNLTLQQSMQRIKLANPYSKAAAKRNPNYGGPKQKPAATTTRSCLDNLEGLPPGKWAKKLASDLIAPIKEKVNTGDHKEIKAAQPCISNGFKHRVKFASPFAQNDFEGFRKEAQSLESAEMPDLLSWERDTGLLTGDPPAMVIDEEADENLLSKVEAMLAASSSSSPSPSPSPESLSPMQCSPAQCFSSSTAAAMELKGHSRTLNKKVTEKQAKERSGIFQKADEKHRPEEAEDSLTDQVIGSNNPDLTSEEKPKPSHKEGSNHSQYATGSIHHNTALIEVMESRCGQNVELNQFMQTGEPSPKFSKEPQPYKEKEETPCKKEFDYGDNEDDTDDNDAVDQEWELEKLFKDSLDLNPTLRHIYDTMSHLGRAIKQSSST